MTTSEKDFKVKNGLIVTDGGTFGGPVVIPEPTEANQAVNKGYVDFEIGQIRTVIGVFLATTEEIDLVTDTVAGQLIDGFTLTSQMKFLVKDQTDESENGIYQVSASGPAIRDVNYDDESKINAGDIVYVETGTSNYQTGWILDGAVNALGSDPLTYSQIFGPNFIQQGNGITVTSLPNGKSIAVNPLTVATLIASDELNPAITVSSLLEVGTLNSLNVSGETNLATLEVSDSATFLDTVTVQEPTASSHPATKNYVDALLNQESVEIKTLDDLSNYFNGYNSRFQPTYQGVPVTLQNPFNLLLTIDGIIQSVGYPDYVWQSVMPRVGFRIDNDGYIAFPEAVPVGSTFDARILVGSATTTQTKVYPFKAMDIVLGGY